MKTNQEKLKGLLSKAKKDTSWKENARERQVNTKTLERSFEIALLVYQQLKLIGKNQEWLAQELGITPQSVSKMLKGKQNFTLTTIEKLEDVLGVQLISILSGNGQDCINSVIAKYEEFVSNGSATYESEVTLNEDSMEYHEDYSDAKFEFS